MAVIPIKRKRRAKMIIGYFCMGPGEGRNSVYLEMRYKPNWFHRAMMRVLLDIKWIDFWDFKKEFE